MGDRNEAEAESVALRVLVADDEGVVRRLVGRLLQRHGHVVTEVEDADAALARVREDAYDAVLLDVRMPGDRKALLRTLSDDARLRARTILITGGRDAELEGWDGEAPPVHRKPFDYESLVRAVEGLARD